MRPICSRSPWLHRTAIVFCLLTLAAMAPRAAADEPQPDKLTLVAQLRAGEFDALEATIVGYQKKFEADPKAQWPVVIAFEAFANSDSALEPGLKTWIAKMPNSYVAPLARGVFYEHLGWLSRGCNCADETPDQRFDEMRDFFALARPDLERARALNPHLVMAYVMLAQIATAVGNRPEMERVLKAGLALAPDSVPLHSQFLFGLQPKWLGAPGDLRRYLANLEKTTPSVAALGWFRGQLDYQTGEDLLARGQYQEAIASFDDALRAGPRTPGFMMERADALSALRRYDDALETVERALEISPQSPSYLFEKGKFLYNLQRAPEALASLDKAVALDRLNPEYLYRRSLALQYLGRHDEALRDLDDATIYGAFDATVQLERSRELMHFSGRQNEAIEVARHVMSFAPRNSVTWLRYAEGLYLKGDCKAQQQIKIFREVCQHDGRCGEEKRDSLVEAIGFMACHKT